MGIGYILLLVFGGYVALKYYAVQVTVAQRTRNNIVARPGISVYCGRPQPSRADKVLAYNCCNTCQVTQPGFAPAFGPVENQPNNVTIDI